MDRMIEMLAEEKAREANGDYKQALRETIQQLVLSALTRTDFFDHAAFYGGTALRIFYGLDRFSEDMDFSLISDEEDFSFEDYLPEIETQLNQAGIKVTVNKKIKAKDTNIESAFLKTNTYTQMLTFYPCAEDTGKIHRDEVLKIKIEIDTCPPEGAGFEQKLLAQPYPVLVKLYDGPSLFAGKLHAVLTRAWRNRVKGRDLYDYLFYIQQGIPVNLHHLTQRLIQSGFLEKDSKDISLEQLREFLREKFQTLDFQNAAKDPLQFLKNSWSVKNWTSELFLATLPLLKAV